MCLLVGYHEGEEIVKEVADDFSQSILLCW